MRTMFSALLVTALTIAAVSAAHTQPDKPAAAAKTTVNLNTASVDQLADLPGVGKATAQRILEYRQKSGGFKKIEEILKNARLAADSLMKPRASLLRRAWQSRQKSQEISQ